MILRPADGRSPGVLVDAIQARKRQPAGDSGHHTPGGAGTPEQADIPGQLRKLAELRDAGILTAEEFEAKKTTLLERM